MDTLKATGAPVAGRGTCRTVKRLRLDVWHNILWSRYKAGVFSQLYLLGASAGIDVHVFQIAETEADRQVLSEVNRALHRYPYELLFEGAYSAVPRWRMLFVLARRAASTPAAVTILAGYHRPEYILQLLVLKLRRRKVAVFCDSTLQDQVQGWWKGLVKKVLFRLADGAFCYGARSAAYLRHYGMPADRIHVRVQAAAVTDGASPEQRLQRRLSLRSVLPLPRFLFVGRLSPEKDVATLLRAFAALVVHHPQATLRVVGQGPLEADLKGLAATLGLVSGVEFLGARDGQALWDEYAATSALVLPSRSEPWGLVVNEALALGAPVVVSNACGCVPELVSSEITGHVFAPGDLAGLLKALRRVAECDEADDRQACLLRLQAIAPYNARAAAEGILRGWRAIHDRSTQVAD